MPSLNDQVLALATGKTQQEITAACKGARLRRMRDMIRVLERGDLLDRDGDSIGADPGDRHDVLRD